MIRTRFRSFSDATLLALFSLAAMAAQSPPGPEAKITVRSGEQYEGQMTFPAEVMEYTGEGLVVRASGGSLRRYRFDDVLKVEAARSASEEQADTAAGQGDFPKALTLYRKALDEETHPQRGWVRRRILARMVLAYRAAGDTLAAADTFLAIRRSDPMTFHLGVIPLEWQGGEVPAPVQQRAVQWLADTDDPVAQLIAASHLLATPQRQAALRRLQEDLGRSRDARLAFLAEAQVWRTRVLVADRHEVDAWTKKIARMPEGLRAGPLYVTGQGYARLGLWHEAALAYLWLPLVYDEDAELAARAAMEAVAALEQAGQQAEATALCVEVTRRFGFTRAAGLARVKLELTNRS